jgi:Ca-activated chloride channel family protein
MIKNTKYLLKKIASGILFYELIFALFFITLLYLLGYFSEEFSSQKLLFKNSNFLFLFWLIPIYYFVQFLTFYKKNNKIKRLASHKVFNFILKEKSSKREIIKLIIIRNVFFFLILGILQPVFGLKKINTKQKSLEIVLAIDISNSMNTKDLSVENSRLQIIKRSMIQLLNSLNGEKIGLCIFAGSAYVQLPITLDYGAAKMFINEIESTMISNQGTNISSALLTSIAMFSKEKTNKSILLVTDGENHDGNINEVVSVLKNENILLAILGIGSEKGGAVPNHPLKPELGFKKDDKGKTIISKLNKEMIQSISKKTNGVYEITSNEFPDLSKLISELSKKKSYVNDEVEINVKQNWSQLFIILALIFLIGYLFFEFKLKEY